MKLLIGAVSVSNPEYSMIHDEARKTFSTVVLNPYGRPLLQEEVEELWVDCDAVICGVEKITAEMLSRAPTSLKVLSKHGVGVDSIDLEAAKAARIAVCNTPGANAQAVAEATIGLMFAAMRNIPNAHHSVVSGRWKRPEGSLIRGKTLGVIGMGSIGKQVIAYSQGFGLNYLAYDPFFDAAFAAEHRVQNRSIEEILEQADIITLHLPCNEATYHLINHKTLAAMKRSAILINTARGDLIDEGDLYDALQQKVIAFAAIDVLAKEPTYESPLFGLENIIITPHLSGNTKETTIVMGMRALHNAVAIINGTDANRVV
ncbi:MAG TPA: phosphoglycerate dehydrogenase [Sphaerochaeta sp.]|nr:phosphoglycerate dehydrogenase [Sphaerochaeta sp.]HQB90727.1 phosphoglycerate dehydrogenase [Sphaerochaeta sp.]